MNMSLWTEELEKQAQAKLNNNLKAHAKKDVTTQLGDGQYLAVVNNSRVKTGTEATEWGTLNVHAEGLADGTVVKVDNKGNYYTIEDPSEDYQYQVQQYREQDRNGRQEFNKARRFQDMAKMADNGQVHPQDKYSLLDAAVDAMHVNAELQYADVLPNKESNPDLLEESGDKYKEIWDRYTEQSSLAQFIMDNTKRKDSLEDYKKLYKEDPKLAIDKLMRDSMSERDKQYYAYRMLTQSGGGIEDLTVEGFQHVLQDVGETLDWLANPVKATMLWLDSQDGNQNLSKMNLKDKTYGEVMESVFQSSWENGGRVSYNYDTGFLPFDFVLEVVSDPEFVLSIGGRIATKGAASTIAKQVVDETGENGTKQFNKIIRNGIDNNLSIDEIADRMAKTFPDEVQDAVRKIATDGLEYSKQYKIARSLGTLKDAKQCVDDMLMNAILPVSVTRKVFGKLKNALENGINTISTAKAENKARACFDAWNAVVEAKAAEGKGSTLTLNTVREFADREKLYERILNREYDAVDKTVEGLDKEDMYYLFREAQNSTDELRYEMPDLANVADNAMMDTLEAYGLTDTPLYKRLTTVATDTTELESVAIPRYAEAVRTSVERGEVNANVAQMFEAVKDTHIDFTEDVAYTFQLNKATTADVFAGNEMYRRLIAAPELYDYTSYTIMKEQGKQHTVLANTIKSVITSKAATESYDIVSNGLESVKCLDAQPELRRYLKDYLFSDKMQAYMRNFQYDVSAVRFNRNAENLAKKWVDGTFALDAKYTAEYANKFDNLLCNTANLEDNCSRIADQFSKLGNAAELSADKHMVFYSVKQTRDEITSMHITDGNVSKTFEFTYAGNNADTIHEMEDFFNQLNTNARRAGNKQVQLCSFNNKATGFDTDRALSKTLIRNKTNLYAQFMKSYDVADELRLGLGLPVPSEELYFEVSNIIKDAARHHLDCMDLTGTKTMFSMTPPALSKVNKWCKDIDTLEYYAEGWTRNASGNFEKGVNRVFSEEDERLVGWLKDFRSEYITTQQNVYKNNEFSKYMTDRFSAMNSLDRWENRDIALRKVWDANLCKQYFNVDLLDFDTLFDETREEMFKFAQQCDTTLEQLESVAIDNLNFSDPKTISNLYDYVCTSVLNANMPESLQVYKQMLGNLAITDDSYKLAVTMTLLDNCGYYIDLYTETAPDFIAVPILRQGKDTISLADIITHRRDIISKNNFTYFDPLEKAPGSFDNAGSLVNTSMRLQSELDTLIRRGASLEGTYDYLAKNNMLKPLAETNMRVFNEGQEALKDLRRVYDDVRNKHLAAHANESMNWFSTNPALKTEMLSHSTPMFAEYNRGLFCYTESLKASQSQYVAHLISKEPELFDNFMAQCANGRLVVMLDEIHTLDARRLEKAVQSLDVEKYAYDIKDGVLRVYSVSQLDATGKVPAMVTNVLQQGYDIGQVETATHFRDIASKANKYNDVSYSFNPQFANTTKLSEQFQANFFSDLEPVEMNKHGYFCSFIGNVEHIRFDGQYMSNNPAVNIQNAWTRTVKQHQNIVDTLDMVFNKGVDTDHMIADLKAHGVDTNNLRDYGYVKCELFQRKGGFGVRETERTGVMTTILRYDDFHALQDMCNAKGAFNGLAGMSESVKNTGKVVSTILKYRQAMISMYLYTNPSTWLNNLVDSTGKAIITEGIDHVPYMFEAQHTKHAFDEAYKLITKKYGTVNAQSIADFFHDGDIVTAKGVISKNRFEQVLTFFQSSVVNRDLTELIEKPSTMDKVLGCQPFGTKGINAKMFEWVETTNRLAIYLSHIDAGDTIHQGFEAVRKSQFDYVKNGMVKDIDLLFPFVSFRLNNYMYWLGDGYIKNGRSWLVGDIAQMYTADSDNEYWSEEQMNFRAWIDTLPNDDDFAKEYKYNSLEQYRGTKHALADKLGWFQINDDLYWKCGFSLWSVKDMLNPLADFGGNAFTPLKTAARLAVNALEDASVLDSEADALAAWITGERDTDLGHDKLYTAMQFIPVLGAMYTRYYTAKRNYLYDQRAGKDELTTLMTTIGSGWFAPSSERKETYLERPIGLDWYNQSPEYKQTHRYVAGVSYVPAWVGKDPATYINTWGRMMQLGFSEKQVQELMETGGGFWFQMNNQGEYELKNYKLLIKDSAMYSTLMDKLINGYGWNPEEARDLLAIAGRYIPKKAKVDYGTQAGHITGYGKYRNVKINPYVKRVPQMRKPLAVNRLTKGEYTTAKTKMYQNRNALANHKGTKYQWHKQMRNIYKDNYGKYGASRMAMRQNPRNYTNRSITEMYRSNSAEQFARIHNRHFIAW